ncbi:MAG: 16S rRNA (uracil(1498)-N(3))-methyltransferase [Pirellulales bacterium]
MSQRYFSESAITSGTVELTGQEAHHLLHVMRMKPGADLVLFDGQGAEFRARIVEVSRASANLEILERMDTDRELPLKITVGVALPKGDRQRWLVEKAVELGIHRFVPLQTERGVAQPTANGLVRLRRTAVEACKQCGRNHVPEIGSAQSFRAFIGGASDEGPRLLAHPGGEASIRSLANGALQSAAAAVLAIGPEGGFTDDEVAAAMEAGWSTVNLGPRVLRVETAALALIAASALLVE